jgi:predicted RNase H-like nuclease (RuvC/YqgF family)
MAEGEAPTTTTTTTSDGSVLVGVQSPNVPSSNYITTPNTTSGNLTFDPDAIAKARQQEKDKLYPQIERLQKQSESMKEEVERLKAEREEREKAEEERRQALEVKSLLEQRTTEIRSEWEEKFTALQQERERDRALLERERSFAELRDYRERRLTEEADNIIPELLDLVSGSTQDEIESSIAGLRERSARIIDSASQAAQAARRDMRGAPITAPPVGPLENQSEQQQATLSAQEIADMPMSEYVKHRARLLGASSPRNRGLFG